MTEVGTLPDIKESVLHYLDSWRSPVNHGRSSIPTSIKLLDLQGECGWQCLLEGFVSRQWAARQQSYYLMTHSHCTGKRWITELIKKLWAVAWNQWEHRNRVLHEIENLVTDQALVRLDADISDAYTELQPLLADTDRRFFSQPLHHLLSRSKRVKETWLQQIRVAKERAFRKHRQRNSLIRMQQQMRQWLNQAR
jgi:hypothetical protein